MFVLDLTSVPEDKQFSPHTVRCVQRGTAELYSHKVNQETMYSPTTFL